MRTPRRSPSRSDNCRRMRSCRPRIARHSSGPYAALDAAAVRTFADRQRFNLQALMVRCAILEPPEWNIGSPRPGPYRRMANGLAAVHADVGGQLVEARAHPKMGGYHHLVSPQCLLDWSEPSVAALLAARAEYALWYQGLMLVRETITGKLAGHLAMPPLAPSRPWVTGAPKPSRVLRAKGAGKLAKLPLKPERPRALAPLRFEAGVKKEILVSDGGF